VIRKTIAINVPAKAPRSQGRDPAAPDDPPADDTRSNARGGDAAIVAQPDDWVRDPDFRPADFIDPMSVGGAARVVLDLAAERTLIEVMMLSALVPFALGWYWFLNASMGRARF
jgi:hypothetical protein